MTANPLSPIPPLGSTTGMVPPPGSGRFRPVDPLRLLRQNMWLLALLVVVGIVLGVGVYFVLARYSPKYTSQAQLRVSPKNPNLWGGLGSEVSQIHMDAIAAQIKNQIVRLKSEETLKTALAQPIVQNTTWYKSFKDDQAAAIRSLQQSALDASIVTGSTLMEVSATTGVAEDAPRILNAVIDTYLRKLQTESTAESIGYRKAYRDELDRAEQEINRLQDDIRQFLSEQDLGSLEARSSAANIDYQRLAQQRVDLALVLDSAIEAAEGLKRAQQTPDMPASADIRFQIETMPAIEGQNIKLRSLREERERLLARFGPSHFMITDLDRQIAAVEAEKEREVQRFLTERQAAQIDEANKTVEALKGQLASLEPKLRDASNRMNDFNERLNRYRQLEDMLESAQDDRDRAKTALANIRLETTLPDAVQVRLDVPPTTPRRTSPKVLAVVPGTMVLVVGLGAGLLLLRELLDQGIKSPSDVKLLENAHLLGVVLDSQEDPSGAHDFEGVVRKDPTGLMAEAFRQVRTAILAKMDRRGYRTLVLGSSQAGCGVSTIVQNLASSLAFNGRKVLIIDANFRRPAQHRLHGIPNEQGLMEVLRGEATVDDVIVPVEDADVAVLPAGHGGDQGPELLEASIFRAMLGKLETQYDMILIDAPPALLTSDTQLLAKHVDALVMVVHAGTDKRGMVNRMLRQLDGHRADVLGLILNGTRASAGGYFRKSYEEFYRYRQNGASSPAPSAADRRNSKRKIGAGDS